jgi:hypothetical protein
VSEFVGVIASEVVEIPSTRVVNVEQKLKAITIRVHRFKNTYKTRISEGVIVDVTLD